MIRRYRAIERRSSGGAHLAALTWRRSCGGGQLIARAGHEHRDAAALVRCSQDSGVLVASRDDAWALRRGLRSRGVGERGGIGRVELSMLEALDSLRARADRR